MECVQSKAKGPLYYYTPIDRHDNRIDPLQAYKLIVKHKNIHYRLSPHI